MPKSANFAAKCAHFKGIANGLSSGGDMIIGKRQIDSLSAESDVWNVVASECRFVGLRNGILRAFQLSCHAIFN